MNNDIERVRKEFEDRDQRYSGSDRYSPFNPAFLYMVQQRQRAELKILRKAGFFPLDQRRILEVGCGHGNILINFLEYGSHPACLYGMDLVPERVEAAAQSLPSANLSIGDCQNIPYADQSFDLVLQYTMLSSVLDANVRQNLAREMLRVAKKTGGAILSYDYWTNPLNAKTQGITKAEIRQLFPNCAIQFHSLTLAPPICRVISRLSYPLAMFLEALKIFNTHFLTLIIPK